MPAPQYDDILIRNFIAKHLDLSDFCFHLSRRLNERYDDGVLPGATPLAKSQSMVQMARRHEETGELVFNLVLYWLKDKAGKPAVLVEEGIAGQLAIFADSLSKGDDEVHQQQVTTYLGKLIGNGSHFEHGYAMLIGVGEYLDSNIPRLPATTNDVKALAKVLQDPRHCAYRSENVHLVTGPGATCHSILGGLDWLAKQTAQDREATVIFYFSGHGLEESQASPARYHLLPYDSELGELPRNTIDDELLTSKLASIKANRLVVILDACHAGGMTKEVLVPPPGFVLSAPPTGKVLAHLGTGRVVISSSKAREKSYVLADASRSIFTQCFIEALSGHAMGSVPGEIGILDAFNYLDREVPAIAEQVWGNTCHQHPVLDGEKTQNFAIARASASKLGL